MQGQDTSPGKFKIGRPRGRYDGGWPLRPDRVTPMPPRWRRWSTPPPASSPRTRSPTRSGGSRTTSGSCSTTTSCRSTRSTAAAEMLVPVFALGEYAEEVMADSFPRGRGRDRLGGHQPPHAQRRAGRPGPDRRRRRGHRDGAGVARLRAAGGRRPRRRRAQRVPDRHGQEVHRRPRSRRSSASPRWRRSRSTRRASATRCASRRAPTGSPGCSTTAPATSDWALEVERAAALERPLSVVVSTSTTSRPSTTPTGTPRATRCWSRRRRSCARRCARTTSSHGSAARSSR